MKFKINGLCTNRCVFCPFHSDPHKLEVEDLAHFFDMIDKPRYRRIDINGGEPTIHPRFLKICDFLKERFKGRAALHLGTNLIPFGRRNEKFSRMFDVVLDTFDMISVGCDDEHNNIDMLEQFGPEIVKAGCLLSVNVMKDYCSEDTRARILALKERLGINVTFSAVHHFYEERPKLNDTRIPCNRQVHEFMMNSDGNAYYCFHQEFEKPLFNLFTVSKEEVNYYLDEYEPEPYRFCAYCPLYKPKMAPLISSKLQKTFSAVKMAS
ncbi:MAG: radical SAM protein [Rhodothermales bacterium]